MNVIGKNISLQLLGPISIGQILILPEIAAGYQSTEFSHALSIFVSEGAPEANQLLKFGFTEGEPNTHPGQGTSNRRFFFNNMMLELLWVSDLDEVKRMLTKPTMFLERWSGRNKTASPFGIIINSQNGEIPFDCWEYKPDYLPTGLIFPVGKNSEILTEPIVFAMPAGGGAILQKKSQPRQSLPPFKNVSSVCVKMPPASPKSSVLKSIESIDEISFGTSDDHVMEIVFDGGTNGRTEDLCPELQLILKW